MAKKKTVVDEPIVNEAEIIETDKVEVNAEAIIESMENVETDIKAEVNIEEVEAKIKEELKPLQEINEQVTELAEKQKEFASTINANPEKTEEIIAEEIKRTEALKTEVEKIIKTTDYKNNKKSISNMTNWWNGMGYDF